MASAFLEATPGSGDCGAAVKGPRYVDVAGKGRVNDYWSVPLAPGAAALVVGDTEEERVVSGGLVHIAVSNVERALKDGREG